MTTTAKSPLPILRGRRETHDTREPLPNGASRDVRKGPIRDFALVLMHVRLSPKADIQIAVSNVRSWEKSESAA